MMTSAAAGALGAAIAVALLTKFLPAKRVVQAETAPLAAGRDFTRWERGLTLAYVLLWFPIAAAVWFLLVTLVDWHTALLPPAEVRITPDGLAWATPSLFAAIGLAAFPADWIARALLRADYPRYQAYYRAKHSYDVDRANRGAFGFIGVLFCAAVALGLNWYVLVRNDALVVNPLLGFRDVVMPYADVQAIQTAPRLTAPNGNIVTRREYLVKFRGGTFWTTNNLMAEIADGEKNRIASFISERSGIPVEEIPLFTKEALYGS
jgi:hypothetical protein